jgi:hypothetical protein
MFAFRERSLALPAGHPVHYKPIVPAAGIFRSSAKWASLVLSFPERKNAPVAFTLCTHFPPQKLQPSCLQEVPHTLEFSEKVTAVFPDTSALFAHFSAQERKSTPLLSSAPALFCEIYRGIPENRVALLSVKILGYSAQEPRLCRPQPQESRGVHCLTRLSAVDVDSQWCYTPSRLQIVTEEKKCVDSPI